MAKKWFKAALPALLVLTLSGCLFRAPDDLYQPPEVPVGYARLRTAIQTVRGDLEAELGVTTDVALIISGDNTATIQLQDLDGDGTRESAVAFLRTPGVEKALKIYIFRQTGEDYQVTGVVEGDGSAIYSVDYVDLNGTGSKELVVNWQISTGAYQLGAYTLDELRPAARAMGAESAPVGRTDLLATELLLTACSGASDVSSTSGGYCLLDLDRDTRTEIAVARIDPGGLNSLIEVYGWRDGSLVSIHTAELSAGIVTLNRIRSNYLRGELYPPALYVSSTLADNSRAVDVLACLGEEKKLTNLSLRSGTGVSRDILQGYTDVALTDINADSVLEIPFPIALPNYGEGTSSNFWLIDWNQYDEAGRRSHILTTYHNVADAWYLEVPDDWRGKITISRNDQVTGQREVVFSLWRGSEEPPQPFLSVYRLTGSNRASTAARGGRFILREDESVIYAARFYDCDWDCGMEEADLLSSFKTIQKSWN